MDHPSLAGVDQGVGDLKRVIDRLGDGEGTGTLGDLLAYRCPFNEFKCDVMIMRIISDREDARDVLVVKPRRGAPFLVKPLHRLGIVGLLGREDLQRHKAVETSVPRAENRPHPADTDRLLQLERIDLIPRPRHRKRRRGGCSRD